MSFTDFTWFYLVLLNFNEFHRVLVQLFWVIVGLDWFLPSLT